MRNQRGQIVLILILVMTVALAIGLSVIQRSLSDVSTSSKVEQSSRAYSAAEAGIEKAINTNSSINGPQPDLGNNSYIAGVQKNDFPPTGQALEYPPLSKEEAAQVWLADPTSNLPTCDVRKTCYNQPTLDAYWGNSSTDQAALELTIIYYAGGQYSSRKIYLDNASASRIPDNNFDVTANCTGTKQIGANTYQCYKRLGDGVCNNRLGIHCTNNDPLPSGLMLVRARLLYNTTSQPFAVGPTAGSLPVQAGTFISTGTSGTTQRKIKVFKLDKVVPPYFDYAIFSAGDINK